MIHTISGKRTLKSNTEMHNLSEFSLAARHLLTTDGWMQDATLTVKDGRLAAITDGIASGAETHDCIISGMPDVHSHAFQRAMAGLTERRSTNSNDSFWTWREWMYKFLDRITPEDNLNITRWLYIELLKAGYTRIGEFHYLHHDANGQHYATPAEMSHTILQASAETGIHLTLLPVHYATSDFGGKPPVPGQRRFIHSTDDFLKLVENLRAPCANQNAILGIAPHSLRAVSEDMLKDVLAALPSLGLSDAPKHIHAAEQVKEVEASLAHSGKRPVEWLLENAPIDKTWCFIHSTHLSEAETDALAASGAVAGLCPTTEGNLGDGIFNGARFFDQNGHFGIGTDSHIMVSPAEELRLFEYSQRLSHKGRALLVEDGKSCGRTLWEKAVLGGNRAMGTHEAGLAVGATADFLTLDLSYPLFAGKSGDAILDTAIFGMPTLPVKDVYVAGKAVVVDGHHPLEAQAARDFARTLARLTA